MRDLKKLMVDLDYESVADEITLLASFRKDFWKVRERQRKVAAELWRSERAVDRIDLHTVQIDGKINRLKGYVRFIEGGWVDERVLSNSHKVEQSVIGVANDSEQVKDASAEPPADVKKNANATG